MRQREQRDRWTPRYARRSFAERRATLRRGVSALALILGFALVVSCLALAIDIGLLVQRHQQLKTAGEAASLAGALNLFAGLPVTIEDDPAVVAGRKQTLVFAVNNSFNEFPLQLNANLLNDPRGDVVAGQVDPLVLGSPFIPAVKRSQHNTHEHGPPPPPQPLNALLVRTRHSQAGGRGPLLFFGSMVGVPSSDVYTESIAAVERRIVGYRPVGCSHVPMLPIVCLTERWEVEDLRLGEEEDEDEDEDEDEEKEQDGGEGKGKGNKLDKYSYDPLTGLVEEGSDGIPEIEFVLKKNNGNQGNGQGSNGNGQGVGNGPDNPGQGDENSNGNSNNDGSGNNGTDGNNGHGHGKKFKLGKKIEFEVVTFADAGNEEDQGAVAAPAPHPSPLPGVPGRGSEEPAEAGTPAEHVLLGLRQTDLLPLDGQVTIGDRLQSLSNKSPGNGKGKPETELDLEEFQAALEQIVGQPRLLLLGSEQGRAAVVQDFAAGVVVHSLLGEGSITIRIQPIVLNSCTAMPSAERQPNPWIGKVVLVR